MAATQTAQVRQTHRGLLWLASVSTAALDLVGSRTAAWIDLQPDYQSDELHGPEPL